MKISEFSKSLENRLRSFFGCDIKTRVYFERGGFMIQGYLSGKEWIVSDENIPLYDIKIIISDDNTPVVIDIDLSFLDKYTLTKFTLPEATEFIVRHLTTPKSKTIYDNL